MGLERNDDMTESEEKKPPVRRASESCKRLALAANKEPTFYIGGGNGVTLINDIMENMGWKRITEKTDDRFKLKWVELKSTINYGSFREGEQLVNHIPNCNLLTNKLGLLNSLQDYDRSQTQLRRGKGPRVKLDFIPETFRLDDPRDREAFFEQHQPGDMWICKPTGRNQGKGIYLVRDSEDIRKLTEVDEGSRGRPCKPLNRIIQRYITNPLLLDNKKFDIRCYMLVASTVPFIVLYHRGYVRTSIHDYDNDCDNLIAHLTNQFIQKKDPTYKDVKEDTAWSMERFNDYLNQHVLPDLGVEPDWALTVLEDKIQQIMTYTFNAVKHKLNAKLGYFDLYGFDFMVDTDLKVYLIEVNVNPCLATNCEALKECVTAVVTETLHVVIECFEKGKRGKPILPLVSPNTFKVLHNGSAGRGGGAKLRRTSSTSPVRSVPAQRDSAKARTPKRPASDSPTIPTATLAPVKETNETKSDPPAGAAKATSKTDKGKKSSLKGATPKATSISATKANSSSKQSAKTKAPAPPPASTVSPYNSKMQIPQDNVKLKMSHNEAKGKQTREGKSPETEDDKDVPNRGS